MPVFLIAGVNALTDTCATVSNSRSASYDTRAAISNSGRSVAHDTRAAISNSGRSVAHDTRATILNVYGVRHDTRVAISNLYSVSHDTRAAISNSNRSVRHDTLFVVPVGLFRYGADLVYFSVRPQRPASVDIKRFQPSGRDGGGALYVYNKSGLRRLRHRIPYTNLPGRTLDELQTFSRQVVLGGRHKFDWIDHEGTVRSVRFAGPRLRSEQVGPDRHRIEIELEEEL